MCVCLMFTPTLRVFDDLTLDYCIISNEDGDGA